MNAKPTALPADRMVARYDRIFNSAIVVDGDTFTAFPDRPLARPSERAQR